MESAGQASVYPVIGAPDTGACHQNSSLASVALGLGTIRGTLGTDISILYVFYGYTPNATTATARRSSADWTVEGAVPVQLDGTDGV
jgi:hypothetical protein